MKLQHIFEARRSGEEKATITSIIRDHRGEPGGLVSFTEIEKLGVNPGSEHLTPLGVYAYPLDYVARRLSSGISASVLPFAGRAPFVNIFTVDPRYLIPIAGLSDERVYQYYDKLHEWLQTVEPKLANELEEIKEEAYDKALVPESPGGRLWYVARAVALKLSRVGGGTHVAMWNKVFRMMGIKAFSDTEGIIHDNEPTQVVVFDPRIIRDNVRYNNAPGSSEAKDRKQWGSNLRQRSDSNREHIRSLPDAESVLKYITQHDNPQDVRWVTNPQVRAELFKTNPRLAAYFPNPTPGEFEQGMKAGLSYATHQIVRNSPMLYDWMIRHKDDRGGLPTDGFEQIAMSLARAKQLTHRQREEIRRLAGF